MNNFALIPSVTILLDPDAGTTSTFPKYWRWMRNPDSGYVFRISCARYGRQSIWLVRVMDISDADWAALSAMADVYPFPPDASLDNPITDGATIDTFFEGFNIPTDWLTPSTTYRELLRSLAHMASILQRFFGIAGYELFTGGVTLDTRFRQMPSASQTALQQAVNELAGQSVPINQNSFLRQLLKQASDVLQSTPVTLGDFTL